MRLMKRVVLFAPAALCAAICFQALVIAARAELSLSQGLFYVFLPACFLLMAGAMVRLGRDLTRLRRRLARLEAKAFPAARSDSASSPGETASSDTDHVVLHEADDAPVHHVSP